MTHADGCIGAHPDQCCKCALLGTRYDDGAATCRCLGKCGCHADRARAVQHYTAIAAEVTPLAELLGLLREARERLGGADPLAARIDVALGTSSVGIRDQWWGL